MESSPPKQRMANIPAVIERITNEIVECLKMKPNPCRIESSTKVADARPETAKEFPIWLRGGSDTAAVLGVSVNATALDSVRTTCRSMVSVITSAAEKKKLK